MDGTLRAAKWDHIIKLFECNPTYKGVSLIKNLSESHCNPNKIPKMKVKFAAQIFSHTVGWNMGFLAEQGLLPEDCKDTADLLLFFDNLFDSLNGSFKNSSKKSGKVLLQAVTPTSKHQDTWNKSKSVLKSMKLFTKEGEAFNY
ncbi:uncharacterized protein LOC123702575 [Colias croceus]|uniref:uncharacterized protein LOC123702575 n=1 Tax=Colias crocea TaxID=72248 RepID=UPI001E27CA37|nr:uncharacterized protein LOC123702575 [Colias croceus]